MSELHTLLSGSAPEPLNRFTALLVIAILISRALDFLATWIVTPGLELEANPLARRVGITRMALLNLLLLGLPLLHHGLAIVMVVASLLVAGTSLSGAAMARGMGEPRQLESQVEALKRIGVIGAVLLNSAGSLLICGAGAFMAALAAWGKSPPFYAPAAEHPSWWAALGVVMFGVSGLVYYNLAIIRLYRRGRRRVV